MEIYFKGFMTLELSTNVQTELKVVLCCITGRFHT